MLVSPELSITYNSFKVGGDQTRRILRDLHNLEQTYEQGTIEYRFTIKQATTALFRAECAAAEAAFTAPYASLSVDVGSTNIISWSHTASTGFNAYPTITKRGEPTDSIRSRTYTVRVVVGLPAGASTASRRVTKTSINVSYTPARRKHVSISVEYTASGGTGSFANYGTAADAYATTILTAITGTYKLAEQPTTDYDDADKVVRAVRIYEEILYLNVGGNDADVRREVVVVSRNKVGPGDTPYNGTVVRLVQLNVNYECWINKEVSTDLRSKWSTLLGNIVTAVRATLGASAVALVSEDPHFDYTDNKITASLTFMGATSNGVIENRVTTSVEETSGTVLVPAWHTSPYSRHIYDGPAMKRKTVTTQMKVVGFTAAQLGGGGGGGGAIVGLNAKLIGLGSFGFNFGPGGMFGIFGGPLTGAGQTALVAAVMGNAGGGPEGGGPDGGGGGGGAPPPAKGWYPMSTTVDITPIRMGIGAYTLDVNEITTVVVAEWAEPIDMAGGGLASLDPRFQ